MGLAGSGPVELTRRLKAWSGGDQSALERLTPFVYSELRRLAACNMSREREGHLLQSSALVNEAFVRLLGGAPVEWDSRAHFFAVSARWMRQPDRPRACAGYRQAWPPPGRESWAAFCRFRPTLEPLAGGFTSAPPPNTNPTARA
jgi:hypothetical protein